MATLPPESSSGDRAGVRHSPKAHRTPGWVKALGIAVIVLVLAFVILHLTGLGFGSHMHHSP